MKINLITGATTYEAAVNTIKQINPKEFETQNLIVVPDTFSMQAENLVFDALDIKASFNIQVVGISKLASVILQEKDIPFQRISALEEVFNIYRAVKTCEENFVYFKKCGIEFCTKILQIIKQFKACKISPNMIKPVGNTNLDLKMRDLKSVYEQYENLLGEKLDLSRLLEISAANAEQNLSKTNLYFVNFDSFSLEVGTFICKLAGCVNSVFIGMAKPISANNAFIFEDDIFKKTMTISKEYGVPVEVKVLPTALEENQLRMAKNLFGFEVEQSESEFFTQVLAKNFEQEVEFVAKYIKHEVFHGAKFADFSIAVSDEKYYDCIKTAFSRYDITFYSDDASNLSQTILARTILKFFEIAKLGFDKQKLQYLATNPLISLQDESATLHDIDFFGLDDEKEFVQMFPRFERVVNQICLLKKCNTIKEFAGMIEKCLCLFDENYSKIISSLEDESLYKVASENSQARELLKSVLDKLVDLGGDDKFALSDFENLFKLSLESVKVETVPSYIDAVFVGDATSSYFEDRKVMFVLGANALPKTRADTGIIDDEDIKKLRLNFALEPEIKVLNRRSRLKLFECLMHAKEKLFVCIDSSENQKKNAPFVNDLCKMFGNNVLRVSSLQLFDGFVLDENEKLEKLLLFLGGKQNLPSAYSLLKSQSALPRRYAGALHSLVNENFSETEKMQVDASKLKKLFKKTYSASSLETYFACPFKFFLQNELKIEEKQTVEPDKRAFGSFEHELIFKFVKENNLKKMTDAEIEVFLSKNLATLAEKHYHKRIMQRKQYLQFLRKESRIVLKNVVYEAKNSEFEPILLEEKILEDFENGKKFVGFVDRVDKADRYFRILDYKTGAQESLRKNLFYGKKLQLFLYASYIQKRLNLDCGGVYYFDCQTKYSKSGDSSVLLHGLTKKDNDVAFLSDKRFEKGLTKSNILSLRAKKTAKDGEFAFTSRSVTQNFEKLFDYAQKISKKAIDEIENGNIDPKPFEGACEFCPYSSVCKYRSEMGYRVLREVDFKED